MLYHQQQLWEQRYSRRCVLVINAGQVLGAWWGATCSTPQQIQGQVGAQSQALLRCVQGNLCPSHKVKLCYSVSREQTCALVTQSGFATLYLTSGCRLASYLRHQLQL
jgi:hypothetical protein